MFKECSECMTKNDNKDYSLKYIDILKKELILATGCTEPISIAFVSSIMTHALGNRPQVIDVGLSNSIIKNAKSVVVPATGGLRGIKASVAAGVIANAPNLGLNVLSVIDDISRNEIKKYMDDTVQNVYNIDSDNVFEIDMLGTYESDVVRVRVLDNHTNVILVQKNGEDITSNYIDVGVSMNERVNDYAELNIKNIVDFANTVDLNELRPLLKRQIDVNMAIAKEGLSGSYGASIGKLLYENGISNTKDKARAYAAAGSDARMSGCEMPVCIVSGSGNQGMTASLPVIIYARELNVAEDVLLRALIVANLTTVYQKIGIGCLSAYCGAVSAGCGSGCGISYLYNGGDCEEIAQTLTNGIAILSGMICDGAKASCAAKIAMAVEAGIMGFEMAHFNKKFNAGDGIISHNVNCTVCNVGRIASEGMGQTNKTIIEIMLGA